MNCVLWLSHQPVWSTWRVYELCSLAQSSTSVIYLEGIWIAFFGSVFNQCDLSGGYMKFGSVINQCDLPGGYMNCVLWLSLQPVWSTWRVYELRSLAQSSTSVIYLEGIWMMFFDSVINQCDLPGGYMNCVLWLSHQPVWSTWRVYELCSLAQSSTSVIYLEGIWIVFFGSVINQCDLPGGYMNCVLWLSLQPVWYLEGTWIVLFGSEGIGNELRALAQSSTSLIYLEGIWIVLFDSVINQCDQPGGYMNCVIWLSHQPVWSTWRVYELCYLAQSTTSVIYLEGIWVALFGSVINQCDLPRGYMNCVIWLSHQPVWSTWRVYELRSLAQSSTSVIYLEGIWIAFFGSVFNQCDLSGGYRNCVLWFSHQPVWST